MILHLLFKHPDDMPEYVSIYDRPKRGRGRPKTCTLTDEEKQRNREANKRCYYNNHSYYLLQKSNYKQPKQESKNEM